MEKNLVAKAAVMMNAPAYKVWEALTDPESIKQYLFGAEIITDWKKGSKIVYKGVYQDRPYEDKGKILKVDPPNHLQITHWSPLSGTEDRPENYHQVDYELTPESDKVTLVTITQDNNSSPEEQEQNSKFWQTVLDGMKTLVER